MVIPVCSRIAYNQGCLLELLSSCDFSGSFLDLYAFLVMLMRQEKDVGGGSHFSFLMSIEKKNQIYMPVIAKYHVVRENSFSNSRSWYKWEEGNVIRGAGQTLHFLILMFPISNTTAFVFWLWYFKRSKSCCCGGGRKCCNMCTTRSVHHPHTVNCNQISSATTHILVYHVIDSFDGF